MENPRNNLITVGLLKNDLKKYDDDLPVFISIGDKLREIAHSYPSYIGGKKHVRIVIDISHDVDENKL